MSASESEKDEYICADCGRVFLDGGERDDHFMSSECPDIGKGYGINGRNQKNQSTENQQKEKNMKALQDINNALDGVKSAIESFGEELRRSIEVSEINSKEIDEQISDQIYDQIIDKMNDRSYIKSVINPMVDDLLDERDSESGDEIRELVENELNELLDAKCIPNEDGIKEMIDNAIKEKISSIEIEKAVKRVLSGIIAKLASLE